MIKAIFFDIHGTLIKKGGEKELNQARKNVVSFLNQSGYEITDSEYYEIWLQNLKKHRQDLEELNEVSFDGWYRGILSDLNIKGYDDLFIEKMNDQWVAGFHSSTAEIPPAKKVLTELKKDFLLGAISNSLGKNTLTDLSITGMIDLFNAIIVSSEAGKRKPHPFIFEKALSELDIKPQEAVFVGDDLYEDIFGAKQTGMTAILFTNQDPLKYKGKIDQIKVKDNKPDFAIDNMGKLPEALRKID